LICRSQTRARGATTGRGSFPYSFAGAGIPGGQVIGASDSIGAEPSAGRVTPKDIATTLYRFLGIDPFQDYSSREGRPYKVLDSGQVVRELLSG